MIQGLGRLGPPIDFPLPEAFQQVRRLQVHHLHLVGRVKHIVGHPLGHGNARDGGHHVVEALQMLDVHRGVHIDPRPQQLLDVLIPLGVAAAGGVGVGQLIHQQQLGVAGQGTVQVKLLQGDALVRHGFGGQDLQPLQQRHGLRPGVGLNIAGHHVNPRLLGTVGGLQHRIGFTHTRAIAKKDFQSSPRGAVRILDAAQQLLRIRPSVFFLHRTPSFLSPGCTGSPLSPRQPG